MSAIVVYVNANPKVYNKPLNKTFFLPAELFFEIKAIAVILVAKGQGLIAVRIPNSKAETKGKLLLFIH